MFVEAPTNFLIFPHTTHSIERGKLALDVTRFGKDGGTVLRLASRQITPTSVLRRELSKHNNHRQILSSAGAALNNLGDNAASRAVAHYSRTEIDPRAVATERALAQAEAGQAVLTPAPPDDSPEQLRTKRAKLLRDRAILEGVCETLSASTSYSDTDTGLRVGSYVSTAIDGPLSQIEGDLSKSDPDALIEPNYLVADDGRLCRPYGFIGD